MGSETISSYPAPQTNAWGRTFAALQHRNYRLWFRGQLVSLLGTWMQMTAQGFLVYELTHSPRYLGLVGFAAGVTYALFGPGWCFTINGLSFIAVIVALKLMTLEDRRPVRHEGGSFAQLTEGIRYVLREPILRTTIGMVAMTSFLALSLAAIMPAWSVDVLRGDATLNGLLLSARGAGSLAGALLIASVGNAVFRGKVLTAGSLAYPIVLFAFAFIRWIPASVLAFAGLGVGIILVFNLANAIVQTSTPPELRGRVMGAYTWIFFGFMPLGALWTGTIAEHFGEPTAVVLNALLAMSFSIGVFLFAPGLRRQQ